MAHRMSPGGSVASLKVHYHPLEVAIRWCGLESEEQAILARLQGKLLLDAVESAEWPLLRLCVERVYDGIRHRELPCGIDGMTISGLVDLNDARLTIRHVDLRAWMARYYPDQRPSFLFSPLEQQASARSVEEIIALVSKMAAMRRVVARRGGQPRAPGSPLSSRAETTYLNIIGAMMQLALGRSPSGRRYTNFESRESLESAVVARIGEQLTGISEQTLRTTLAAANRRFEER